MQISTNLMFDRAITQMGTTQDRLAKTQAQLASSKEVISPSDAPDKSATITRLKSIIARQNSYSATMRATQDKLSAQESALTSATDVLVRIKELTVQAANDTTGPEGRKLINIEVRELRAQLLSLANAQDVNGNYIFSGSRVTQAAFSSDQNGKLVYQGDQTVSAVAVGEQRNVDNNRTGTEAFGRVIRSNDDGSLRGVGFFQAIDDLSYALENNQMPGLQRAINEINTMGLALSESLASVGARMNTIDTQTALIDETVLRLKSTLSEVEDVDYTQAITKMNKDMLALEAAQSSFAKISQLSLFDYIR